MTDFSHDRDDAGTPPTEGTQPDAGTPPTAGGTPPAGDTPPAGGTPSADGPAPAGGTPPADGPPPAPNTPAPTPQTQWPQAAGMSASEQRNWATGAHIGALAASVLTGLAFLGPLIVYLVKKDEDAFVREHSREALNFQLTWWIGGFVGTIVAVILSILTIGLGLIVFIPAGIGFFIAWIVFMVKASMAASRGEYYRYPLTVRMIS